METAIRRDSRRGPWGPRERAPGSAFSWIGVWERQGRSEAWIAQQLLISVDELRRHRERENHPEPDAETRALHPGIRPVAARPSGARSGSPVAGRGSPREAVTVRDELVGLARAASRSQARPAERAEAIQALVEELEGVAAVLRAELHSLGGRGRARARPLPATRGAPPLRLQTVSPGELRALGLSRTQAQRLVLARERGEVRSVADIDSVRGFPRDVHRILANALAD